MTAIEAILRDEPYPLRAMIVTGANPASRTPTPARVLEALSSARPAGGARPLHDRDGRPGRLRPAGGLVPGAHRAARSRKHQIVSVTREVVSWPGVQTEYEFWHDLAARLGIGEYFPWEDETRPQPLAARADGHHARGAGGASRGGGVRPASAGALEGAGFDTPSGKVEFTSQYLEGPGVRRAARSTEAPPIRARTRRRVPVRAHHRGAQAPLPAQPVSQHPPLPDRHPRPRGRRCTRTTPPRSGVADGDTVARDVAHRVARAAGARSRLPTSCSPARLQLTHGWAGANVNLSPTTTASTASAASR